MTIEIDERESDERKWGEKLHENILRIENVERE